MIIALDIETTWLDEFNDEIIEIALVKFDNKFNIISSKNYLINPWIEIPEIISNITWIKNDDVINSPKFLELSDEINNFIWDLPILWHNINFDIKFLKKYWLDFTKNIFIDTLSLANFLLFDKSSLSLESLALDLNFKTTKFHRALNDVYITIELFKYEIELIKSLENNKKLILKYLFSKSEDNWFHYILDNYIKIKDDIDKNLFLKKIIKLFPKNKEKTQILKKKVDTKIENIIDNIDNFEIRKNQLLMLDFVKESFFNNKKIVIEAPTWVWKTFWYLIPSIIYSLNTWEQVFISTSTKALQDQIFYKDLNFLFDNLWLDFTFTKLKWKANYISLMAFLDFFESIEFFDKEKVSFLLKIIFWLFQTSNFELDELEFFPYEFWFLNDINSNNLLIFSNKNNFFDREPVLIHRKKAKNSNIVIINNNILFQDFNWDSNILGWKIKNLVIDEAHNLEDVVTNSLKKEINLLDLEKKIEKIKKILQKNSLIIEDYLLNLDKLLFDLDLFFWELKDYLFFKLSKKSTVKKALFEADFYKIKKDIIDIKKIIMSIMSNLLNIRDKLVLLPDFIFLEINKEISYIDNFIEFFSDFLNEKKLEEVIIILKYSDKLWLLIEKTILNPWDYLSVNLWNKLDSCILTSATLKTSDSFDYLKNILALKDFFSDFYELKSDFNYDKQALLYIPNDLWSIKINNNLVIDFIKNFIQIVKWNTLILFTSFSMIKEVYSSIWLAFKKEKLNIFVQWISWSKHKILSFFKKNPQKSIILWTDTFWEWIDLSWEDLKYLIIHKIPFMVPDDPIFLARTKLFKDSFYEYSIPKAILKLKQWFWRLIRTKKDKWIIVFLDDRIYSTAWGELLKTAFPKNILYKTWPSFKLLEVLKLNK